MKIVMVLVIVVVLGWITFQLKRNPVNTASGAIVMAFCIFIYRALEHFHWLLPYGKEMATILFLIWMAIIASLIKEGIRGNFRKHHLIDPLNVFATGTWIAGTSMVVNVLTRYFGGWIAFLKVLAVFDILAWGLYILLCLQAYRELLRIGANRDIHGIILLTTVSTQSLVLILNALLDGIPDFINVVLIGIGVAFYVIGYCFLLNRYVQFHKWHLIDDWPASNCIVHGAISITGLASVISGTIDQNLILLMWVWVVCWFFWIECLEGFRALLRIQRFGVVKGIGEYHVTHWSRIFTFGMFYAFTETFYWLDHPWFLTIRHLILAVLPWLILILLINEILLYLKEKMKKPIVEVSGFAKKT